MATMVLAHQTWAIAGETEALSTSLGDLRLPQSLIHPAIGHLRIRHPV